MDRHGFNGTAEFAPLDWLLTHPRRTRRGHRRWPWIAAGALALVALALTLWHLAAPPPPVALPPGPPPRIDAPFARQALRPLSRAEAERLNARIATTRTAVPPALAFLAGRGAEDQARALQCLTLAVYYEAGREPLDGQRAVAQVVLNRVRHPAYPHSVCGVVWQGAERAQGCQFTFTCDGALARRPDPAGWARALGVARAALAGSVFAPVGWATHYHASYVLPYWAASLDKVAVIGAHIFYRWTGGWGRPEAFAALYAGREPTIAAPPQAVAAAMPAPALAAPSDRPIPAQDRPVLGNDAALPLDDTPAPATRPRARWILDNALTGGALNAPK